MPAIALTSLARRRRHISAHGLFRRIEFSFLNRNLMAPEGRRSICESSTSGMVMQEVIMKAKPAVVASGRFARSTVDKSDSFQGDLTRTAVKHSTAGVVLVALALAVQSVIAHADTPPKLNMVPTCDAAASYAGLADRDKTSCMTDENDALAALKKNWSQYSSPDKTDCVGMVKTGGPPSYVELLSCLEMMKDVAAIHKSQP